MTTHTARSHPMRSILPILAFAGAVAGTAACSRSDPLLEPRPARVDAQAPDSFLVRFETSRGPFTVMAHRAWSPAGVDRFHYLVINRFFDDTRFFRVIPNFVAQFGLPADPAVAAAWRHRAIPDDTLRVSNSRGTVAFARGGPATRSTQLFVNLRDNARLDTLNGFGFPPIGEVVEGMYVVDSLHAGYGEAAPRGRGPVQDSIRIQGNPYLDAGFPLLDAIRTARVAREWRGRR